MLVEREHARTLRRALDECETQRLRLSDSLARADSQWQEKLTAVQRDASTTQAQLQATQQQVALLQRVSQQQLKGVLRKSASKTSAQALDGGFGAADVSTTSVGHTTLAESVNTRTLAASSSSLAILPPFVSHASSSAATSVPAEPVPDVRFSALTTELSQLRAEVHTHHAALAQAHQERQTAQDKLIPLQSALDASQRACGKLAADAQTAAALHARLAEIYDTHTHLLRSRLETLQKQYRSAAGATTGVLSMPAGAAPRATRSRRMCPRAAPPRADAAPWCRASRRAGTGQRCSRGP